MNSIEYLNFIIANAFIVFALLFFMCGLFLGLKAKNIRKNIQRHTSIVFVDTGEIFDFWGWGDIFSLDDADYVIDHHKTKGRTIFFDSRFAEPPTFEGYNFNNDGIPAIKFEPDMIKWRYWIDSKMFFRVYENRILEKMMQIQASDLIKIILGVACVGAVLGLISVYLIYQVSSDTGAIGLMVSDIVKALKVG